MPEHTGKENQAIENPPVELDSLPCYYTARHKGESSEYAKTWWLQRYECSDEHSVLPPASVWARKPFTVVFVKRKCSDSSTCMGKSAFIIFSSSGQHVLWEKKKGILGIPWLCFLHLLWVKGSWAIESKCVQSQGWRSGALSSSTQEAAETFHTHPSISPIKTELSC